MKLKLISTQEKDQQITAAEALFNRPNDILLAQAIRVYLANQRQGTSKVKTRSEVSRTTRKVYRQKGTGNARHGAKDAPIFVGGGVAHGPTGEENWHLNLTKTLRNKALAAVFSAQMANCYVNDELANSTGKTAPAAQLLTNVLAKIDSKLQLGSTHILIIVDEVKPLVVRALRNIPLVKIVSAGRVNPLVVAQARVILMTKPALDKLVSRVK